jgi:hypothetical protein
MFVFLVRLPPTCVRSSYNKWSITGLFSIP